MSNLKFNFIHLASTRFLIATGLLLTISGCYTMRFYHDSDLLREKYDGEISSISMPFTDTQIGGPAQIRTACPSGASLVEIEQTTLDGLTHYLSLGLYSPHTVRVWCKRRNR